MSRGVNGPRSGRAAPSAAAALAAVLFSACQQSPAPPAGGPAATTQPRGSAPARPAPTLDELAGATYTGLVDGQAVTLSGGVWEAAPAASGATSQPRAELLRGVYATGDLTGEPGDEAIGLVAVSSGGTGMVLSLVVVGRDGDRLAHLGAVRLGNHVQIKAARVEQGRLVADVVRHGGKDPSCCPAERARLAWALEDGALTEMGNETIGRLSLEDLAGPEWILTHWATDEPASGDPAPTLTVVDGRLAGRAGCNRYTAAVTTPAPGQFAVSRIVSTRMACPPPEDAVERRFLELLPRLRGYAFVGGDLILTHDDGVLRFRAQPRRQVPPPAVRPAS